jgi:hypothetical protein
MFYLTAMLPGAGGDSIAFAIIGFGVFLWEACVHRNLNQPLIYSPLASGLIFLFLWFCEDAIDSGWWWGLCAFGVLLWIPYLFFLGAERAERRR